MRCKFCGAALLSDIEVLFEHVRTTHPSEYSKALDEMMRAIYQRDDTTLDNIQKPTV